MFPMLYSPESNAFFFACTGAVSPYGTTISESEARLITGRSTPWSRNLGWCRTRPSRGVKPTRKDQSAHCTWFPVTWNEAPSGWVISIGFRSVRAGPTYLGR